VLLTESAPLFPPIALPQSNERFRTKSVPKSNGLGLQSGALCCYAGEERY
jgi:hypothetical protein